MKGTATVGMMLLMGLVAFAYLSLGSAQEIGCTDQPTSFDLNGDGKVSSIDQMCLARHYGEELWTPSSVPSTTPTVTSEGTSTPTTVASPSSTSTPTFTTIPATSTPTPMTAPTITQIIADSHGDHDGCLDPSISSYDWYTSARPGTYNGAPNLTSWYQIAWDHCAGKLQDGVTLSNDRVYVRNFAGFKLTSAGWQSIGSGPAIGQWGNYPISFVGGCSGWVARQEADGLSFSPSSNKACIAHGWTWPRGSASGIVCALVRLDVRGDGPFLVNVGIDEYDGDAYWGDMGIGAFRRVTGDWRRVWMTSCTEGQLQAAGVP